MSVDVAITRIQVVRFRALAERPLDETFLSPQGQPAAALVIAGTNGSGKTSVLEAILFALGQEAQIQHALVDSGPYEGEGRSVHPRARFPEEAKVKVQLRLERAPGTLLGSLAPCKLLLTRDFHGHTLSIQDEKGVLRTLPQEHLAELPHFFPVKYFSSLRTPSLLGAVIPTTGGRNQQVFNERYRLQRLKQLLLNERLLRSFSQSMPKDEHWLKQLTQVWRRLRPFDEVRIDIQPRNPSDAEQGFDLAFIKDTDFGPQTLFFVDDASSGELELLTLFGSLIVEDFKGLLLIDEPELHLHAEWHRLLLPTLREVVPHTQIIIATHADAPWDQAHGYQRLLLHRKPLSDDGSESFSDSDDAPQQGGADAAR